MGWLKSILDLLLGLVGFGKSVVDNKREERVLVNSPEMKKREEARIEVQQQDQEQKTVEKAVQGDPKALDELRKNIG